MGVLDRLRAGSRVWNKTIAVVPPQLRNVGVVSPKPSLDHPQADDTVEQDTIKIRLAHDASRTSAASILVEKRYKQKGYGAVVAPDGRPACAENVTLTTYKGDELMGTLSIGFDNGNGLSADEVYHAEVEQLRKAGRRVCEFTRLAIDNDRTNKQMLAALVHIAFIYAERIWGYNDIVIEVNPSHVSFYRRMMGLTVLGSERICPRVNAPAVLMRVDTQWAREMIEKFGGHPELSKSERSLYPYFLSRKEEQAILERMSNGA